MIAKIRLTLVLLIIILPAKLLLAQAPAITYVPDKPVPAELTFTVKTNTTSITSRSLQVLATGALPTPVITFTIPLNSYADANGNITPGATSTNSESPIYYTSSDPTKATITPDGLIHLVGAGPVTITAHQNASASYNAAVPVDVQLSVIRSQHIIFPPLSDKTICDADFSANVSTAFNSGNPITYTSLNTQVATISSTGIIHVVGPGSVTIIATQAGSTYYILATNSQTLTVNQPVNPAISISAGTYTPCDGSTLIFTASVTNAGSSPVYQWQINGAPVLNNNTNTLSGNTFQNNDVISCKVTNTTDCSTVPTATSNSITASLNPYIAPTISIASSVSGPVCAGSSIAFTAISNLGANASYQWLVNGVNSGTNSPTFTTATLNDGDVVICQLTAGTNACAAPSAVISNSITGSIVPNEIPSITVEASANRIYTGSPVTFTATVTNITATPYYQWQVNGVDAGINSPAFSTGRLKNNDVVTCTVTSVTGCVAPVTGLPVTMVVMPPPTVSINNTFTPNGDGVNDVWNIPDLSFYPNCLVSIFDRSGSLVYQSKGYSKPWDGIRNGRQLITGTYYYVIKLSADGLKLAGSITIIR